MVTKITPVEVGPDTAYDWIDVDVSSHVSSDTVGVFLHINEITTAEHDIGVRKNGSSYAATNEQFEDDSNTWIAVGVDSNNIFEVYTQDIDVEFWLTGYVESDEGGFFTNKIDYLPASDYSWTDIDISSDTGTDTASVAFFDMQTSTGDWTDAVLRENGSTDSRRRGLISWVGGAMSVDSNEILEAYYAETTSSERLDLSGYLTEDAASTITNAVDYSTDTTASWVNTDLSADLPDTSVFALHHFSPSTGSEFTGTARKPGSTELNDTSNRIQSYHNYGFTQVDSTPAVDQYIGDTAMDFYVWGAATEAAKQIPEASANTLTASETVNITESASITSASASVQMTYTGDVWWDTQSDWDSYQSQSNVIHEVGTLMLSGSSGYQITGKKTL